MNDLSEKIKKLEKLQELNYKQLSTGLDKMDELMFVIRELKKLNMLVGNAPEQARTTAELANVAGHYELTMKKLGLLSARLLARTGTSKTSEIIGSMAYLKKISIGVPYREKLKGHITAFGKALVEEMGFANNRKGENK